MLSAQFDMRNLCNDTDSANTLKEFLTNRHYATSGANTSEGRPADLSEAQQAEIEKSFAAVMGVAQLGVGYVETYWGIQRDRAHVAESVVIAAHQALVAMATPNAPAVTVRDGFSACELTAAVTAAICDVAPSPAALTTVENKQEFNRLQEASKRLINSNRQAFQVLLEQKFKEIKGYDTHNDYVVPLESQPLAQLQLRSQKPLFNVLYRLIVNYVFARAELLQGYFARKNYDDRYAGPAGSRVQLSAPMSATQPAQAQPAAPEDMPARGGAAKRVEYQRAPSPVAVHQGGISGGPLAGEATPLMSRNLPGSPPVGNTNWRSWLCSWKGWLISSLSTIFVGCASYTGWSTNNSLEALLDFLTNAASYGATFPSKWELFLQTHGRTLFSDPNNEGELEITAGRLVAFITAAGLGATAIGYGCKALFNCIQQRRRHAGYAPMLSGAGAGRPLVPLTEVTAGSGSGDLGAISANPLRDQFPGSLSTIEEASET